MDFIPEDELLERLPEKSLCRFKSLSKQWKSMIESSYLAKKRLVRYPNPKFFVLHSELSTDRSSRTHFLETVSKDHQDHNKLIVYTHNFPPHQRTNSFDYHPGRIMGYCNGLVCIYDYKNVYLINPTTRKLRILDRELLLEHTGQSGLPGKKPISVGFGRDIVTKAYKVIFMYLFDRVVKTEVLNLNNGERRCICFPLRFDRLPYDKSPIYVNGSLFWLSWIAEPGNMFPQNILTKLGAIDLHTEQFRDVLLPTQYTKYSGTAYIWSLRDRLCISDVLQYPNVDVWSLQQEDPTVKWEKIHSIDIFSIDLDPNYWKLALAAFYHRRRGYDLRLPKYLVAHVLYERKTGTVLCTENLVSSV